jgi:polygalacturonase
VLIEGCDIRSPFAPVPAPSTDGIDIDVCKRITVRNCFISVNDDAVCIKGGKGPDAHKLPQNGIVEDVLVENCNFGDSHGTLTLGSECIHARNITIRNCTMNNNCPILRLKMRPDTYQLFENITVKDITGKCGTIIDMNPWKQFFNLKGSHEQPSGIIRNITFSNVNVSCNRFGTMNGNPPDQVSNILFINSKITAQTPALKTTYSIKTENVLVNGAALVVDSK